MKSKVIIATILAIFLLAPVLFKKEHQPFNNYRGTRLSELNFQEMSFFHAIEDFKIAKIISISYETTPIIFCN